MPSRRLVTEDQPKEDANSSIASEARRRRESKCSTSMELSGNSGDSSVVSICNSNSSGAQCTTNVDGRSVNSNSKVNKADESLQTLKQLNTGDGLDRKDIQEKQKQKKDQRQSTDKKKSSNSYPVVEGEKNVTLSLTGQSEDIHNKTMKQKRRFRIAPPGENSPCVKLNMDIEGAKEYMCPTEKDGDIELDVECGPNKALLYLSKLCQGSKGQCVLFQGSWLTPNEFQYVSGRETAKDWKRSIRHRGKSIKLLFAKGILKFGDEEKSPIFKQKAPKKQKKKPEPKRKSRKENSENSTSEENKSMSNDNDVSSEKTDDSYDGDESGEIHSDDTENYDLDEMDENDSMNGALLEKKIDTNVTVEDNLSNSGVKLNSSVNLKSHPSENSTIEKSSNVTVNSTDVADAAMVDDCSGKKLKQNRKTKTKDVKRLKRDSIEDSKQGKITKKEKKPLESSDDGSKKELKLGSIIDQLRENREKGTTGSNVKEPTATNKDPSSTPQTDCEKLNDGGPAESQSAPDCNSVNGVDQNKEPQDDSRLSEATSETNRKDNYKSHETCNEENKHTLDTNSTQGAMTSSNNPETTTPGTEDTNPNDEIIVKNNGDLSEKVTGNASNFESVGSSNSGTSPLEGTKTNRRKFHSIDAIMQQSKSNKSESSSSSLISSLSSLSSSSSSLASSSSSSPTTTVSSSAPTTLKSSPLEVAKSIKEDLDSIKNTSWSLPEQEVSKGSRDKMPSASIIPPHFQLDKYFRGGLTQDTKLKSSLVNGQNPKSLTSSSSTSSIIKIEQGSIPEPKRDGKERKSAGNKSNGIDSSLSTSASIAASASFKDRSAFKAGSMKDRADIISSSKDKRDSEWNLSSTSPMLKDYNDYMRLLAVSQEHHPLQFQAPFLDPYYSLLFPEMSFAQNFFNPYSLLTAQKSRSISEAPSFQSSLSPSLSSLYSFPQPSLSFMPPTARFPYHGLSYPFMETPTTPSAVKATNNSSERKSPDPLKIPARKRSPPEGDTPCALDLTVKRQKYERENVNSVMHTTQGGHRHGPENGDVVKGNFSPLNLKMDSSGKKSNAISDSLNLSNSGDVKQKLKSSLNSHSKKLLGSWWPDVERIATKCKCGADNPENIMNWSARKVYDFISGLEGCSSYAKLFLDHKIEGKMLPLLTTDTLIRNLGLKVGPAIILSEAVTRHVQDMSRFFHPCEFCRLTAAQRVSA